MNCKYNLDGKIVISVLLLVVLCFACNKDDVFKGNSNNKEKADVIIPIAINTDDLNTAFLNDDSAPPASDENFSPAPSADNISIFVFDNVDGYMVSHQYVDHMPNSVIPHATKGIENADIKVIINGGPLLFDKLIKLRKKDFEKHVISFNNNQHILTGDVNRNVNIKSHHSNRPINITCNHLMAKLKFILFVNKKFKDINIDNITIHNIADSVCLGGNNTVKNNTFSDKIISYSEKKGEYLPDSDKAFNVFNDPNLGDTKAASAPDEFTEYTLGPVYLCKNMYGDSKIENAPENATYIEVQTKSGEHVKMYIGDDALSRRDTKCYIGGCETIDIRNYDVKPNYVYNAKMFIYNFDDINTNIRVSKGNMLFSYKDVVNGSSNDNLLSSIEITSGFTGYIDWGDGTITYQNDVSHEKQTHTYTKNGTYNITVYGDWVPNRDNTVMIRLSCNKYEKYTLLSCIGVKNMMLINDNDGMSLLKNTNTYLNGADFFKANPQITPRGI